MTVILGLLPATPATAQTAFPDHVVQGASWSSGVYDVAVTQKILSPGDAQAPMDISGPADAEFVSGTQVHLAPGFHAGGFTGAGTFHAHIDPAVGPDGDVVLIAPGPDTAVTGHLLHVPKWEKLEIGLRLPEDYRAAIDSFFTHYYADPNDPYMSTPGNVDPAHDLNPYADDSLQLVMTLTRPDGTQTLKWGFFMKEAQWADSSALAMLAEDTADVHYPYNIRYRIAPDTVGTWQFTLSIAAPHTTTAANDTLPSLLHTGYAFVCDPPLPDNHGFLEVNPANRRTLRFQDGTAFFGLGVNMADVRRLIGVGTWYAFHQRDFDAMQRTMAQLSDVGGNFMRMYLMRHLFAPEWVNLGVYDAYHSPKPCADNTGVSYASNCQWQCWAFDRMLEQARAQDIHVQLCLDPYPPIVNYETFIWGSYPYLVHFLEPERDTLTGLMDMKKFFYMDGDTTKHDTGVFYYWKRKYKYMMSRWGYSVNIAALEPFNEIDQLLTYREQDLTGNENALCPENKLIWPADPALPAVVDQWVTDMAHYVRDPVDLNHPITSPLGEDHRLFAMSYTDAQPANTSHPDYFLPFDNPEVDLLDVHYYIWPNSGQADQPDVGLAGAFDHAQSFRSAYPSDPNEPRKPFNHGESNYFTQIEFGGTSHEIEKFFHNYDVSFHNELWSSAFSGGFATGLTWHWERVFWWADALKPPPTDPNNIEQGGVPFSNVLGDVNRLDLGLLIPIPDTNRTLYHHFKPLADLLTHPTWMSYDLFNGPYTANKVISSNGGIESYYLKDSAKTVAIGWVHNRNAWTMNSFYLANTDTTRNLLGCTAPGDQSITLSGFLPDTAYHITWFPTRMEADTVLPLDTVWTSTGTGNLLLDLSTAPFGDTIRFFADTLRSDYAFVISLGIFPKSLMLTQNAEGSESNSGLDFTMYPNPAHDVVYLRFFDDAPKDISVVDVTGRRVIWYSRIRVQGYQLNTDQLAKGIYYIAVEEGTGRKTKKLIIN